MSTESISANEPAVSDGLPAERRKWAVTAIFTALTMASLDTAIANIALPAIAADLHVGPADVIWVVNVYQIALVATLLPLGALGEIVGHRRIYLAGLLLRSRWRRWPSACAWSRCPACCVARALQGLGASGIMSVNTALLRYVYPGRLLGRGFRAQRNGWWRPPVTLGLDHRLRDLAIGPWPWLFAVNIPFGVVAMAIGLKTLSQDAESGAGTLPSIFQSGSSVWPPGCLGLLHAVG